MRKTSLLLVSYEQGTSWENYFTTNSFHFLLKSKNGLGGGALETIVREYKLSLVRKNSLSLETEMMVTSLLDFRIPMAQ